MKEITISIEEGHGTGTSTVVIGTSLQRSFREYAEKFGSVVIIAGKGVADARNDLVSVYSDNLKNSNLIVINDGEDAKSFASYSALMSEIAKLDPGRKDLIAYIGGGTVGDVAGFAAATYKRGLKLCAVPTTLLSQADSSIGGKNGINISGYKNLAGTFHNADRIFCDIEFLKKMDSESLNDSLSEIIKYGFIADKGILEILLKHKSAMDLISKDGEEIVSRSVMVKKNVVERDPLETREVREILNVGHTVAHALETASANSLSHGRAVLIGLMAESYISDRISGRESDNGDKIREIADHYAMKYTIPSDLDKNDIAKAITKDKKISGNTIVFPVLISPGNVRMQKVDLDVIQTSFIEWLKGEGR